MMCGFDPQSDNQTIVDKDCVKIGKALVAAGATVTKTDNHGCTALHMAAMQGLPQFSRFLINATYSESWKDTENREVMREFIHKRDEDGRTALMKAISHGHYSTVKAIVKFGVDFTICDNYNASVLHYAVQSSLSNATLHTPILRLLVQHLNLTFSNQRRQLMNLPDNDGRTPLMYAVIDHPKSLLSQKPDEEENDGDVETRKMKMYEYLEIIRILLDGGADPTAVDSYGVSALSMAPTAPPSTTSTKRNNYFAEKLREMLAVAAADQQLRAYEEFQSTLPVLDEL